MNHDEIIQILKSNNTELIANTLLDITFNDKEWEWVQNQCLFLIQNSNDNDIKELAITCLGHIARIHSKIDKNKVFSILGKASKENKYLAGRVEDAIDDINMFVTSGSESGEK